MNTLTISGTGQIIRVIDNEISLVGEGHLSLRKTNDGFRVVITYLPPYLLEEKKETLHDVCGLGKVACHKIRIDGIEYVKAETRGYPDKPVFVPINCYSELAKRTTSVILPSHFIYDVVRISGVEATFGSINPVQPDRVIDFQLISDAFVTSEYITLKNFGYHLNTGCSFTSNPNNTKRRKKRVIHIDSDEEENVEGQCHKSQKLSSS